MFTAAGKSAAVSSAVYIEDVFSTWLYTGTGAAQSINNGIGLGNSAANNSSVSLNASNPSYLTFSSQVNLSGDFCIQAWVYPTSLTGTRLLFSSTTDNNVQLPRIQENGGIYCYVNGTEITSGAAASALQANVWTHLAMTRSGTTFRVFVNGVLYTTATYSGTFNVGVLGAFFFNGSLFSTNYAFGGNISNAQVVSGSAIYTTDFTPPQNTLIGGSVLLGAGATPLADTSGTGKTVTQFGSPAASSSGPWAVGGNKGGMVWFKNRNGTFDHAVFDTARGATKSLRPNDTSAEATETEGLTAFNSNGFSTGSWSRVNTNTSTYASWTFRKQAKFFDVVTYTGNGVSGRTVAHNLGSVPGCIIVKCTSAVDNWNVYHRSLGNTQRLNLNLTQEALTDPNAWNNTTPTSLVFTVGNNSAVNANGATYVAYLFAHDAGGFGATGSDNVITCGSVVGSGTTSVTLGYEPQWILMKNRTSAQDWWLVDNMRGLPAPSANARLLIPNKTDAEAALSVNINSTGFTTAAFSSGETYIYIAIRRGPMKTPTSGTTVYSPVARTGTGAAASISSVPFPPDWVMFGPRSIADNKYEIDRLRGASEGLITNSTSAGIALGSLLTLNMNGISFSDGNSAWNQNAATYVNWFFGRAPGFFDVVCYTGTGSNDNKNHNLAVVPELIILKARSSAIAWYVMGDAVLGGAGRYLSLNTTAAYGTGATHLDWTSTTFSVGSLSDFNGSGTTYVAYLFASCPGVSKVGSYTGTGALQTVNCGFAAGARYVLIKRTDSTGAWYVYDSARGISSGNDPYLLLNSNAAEIANTNYVDTASTGFQVTAAAPADLNANGGTYLFLAIA